MQAPVSFSAALLAALVLLPGLAAAEAPGWAALLEKARVSGEYRTDPTEHFYLERFVGDRKGPHRAEYVVVEGGMADGKFIPGYVRLVSEDWAAHGSDKILLTVWWLSVDLQGELFGRFQSHTQLRGRGDSSSRVYEQKDVKVNRKDALAKRDELIKFWLSDASKENK